MQTWPVKSRFGINMQFNHSKLISTNHSHSSDNMHMNWVSVKAFCLYVSESNVTDVFSSLSQLCDADPLQV